MPALVPTLQVMAAAHDVSPLLRYLLPHLIRAVFTCSSGENWSHKKKEKRVESGIMDSLSFYLTVCVHLLFSVTGETDELSVLESVLQSVPLTKGLDQTVAR